MLPLNFFLQAEGIGLGKNDFFIFWFWTFMFLFPRIGEKIKVWSFALIENNFFLDLKSIFPKHRPIFFHIMLKAAKHEVNQRIWESYTSTVYVWEKWQVTECEMLSRLPATPAGFLGMWLRRSNFALAFLCQVFLGGLPSKYWPRLASNKIRHSTTLPSVYSHSNYLMLYVIRKHFEGIKA